LVGTKLIVCEDWWFTRSVFDEHHEEVGFIVPKDTAAYATTNVDSIVALAQNHRYAMLIVEKLYKTLFGFECFPYKETSGGLELDMTRIDQLDSWRIQISYPLIVYADELRRWFSFAEEIESNV